MNLLGSEVRTVASPDAGRPDPDALITLVLHTSVQTSDSEVKLHSFCADHDLAVDDITDDVWRLKGTVANCETAFGVSLFHAETDGVTHRARSGWITIPDELSGIVDAVLGLDNPPIAHYMYRIAKPKMEAGQEVAVPATLSPRQVGLAYEFPMTVTNGLGSRIAIIELGGKYNPADTIALCKSLNVVPPHVNVILVDKDHPVSDGPSGADGEVMLDVEIAGAIANHAIIDVYFAPNTDAGFLDAINQAIHSKNRPDAISISWGSREDAWTGQAIQAMSIVIQKAGPLGVTVCAASGDGGSDDGQGDGVDLPDFPASSPYALGCGGTALVLSGITVVTESVWEDDPSNPDNGSTGGGISSVFPRPAYQDALVYPVPGKTGRMVPDIAGDADPNTGYNVIVDGRYFPIGGTSAVAPLMAAMVCLLNEALKTKVGFLNPKLYAVPQATFNQITSGKNGAYSSNPAGGYCCCTGLGSPNFLKLVAALKKYAEEPAEETKETANVG